ncbi:hypothetical protein FEM08_04930 [Flavobacterium gilvum]|nr:hypothetical protein FEM08_04930 [Flavobacterium gilvum]
MSIQGFDFIKAIKIKQKRFSEIGLIKNHNTSNKNKSNPSNIKKHQFGNNSFNT